MVLKVQVRRKHLVTESVLELCLLLESRYPMAQHLGWPNHSRLVLVKRLLVVNQSQLPRPDGNSIVQLSLTDQPRYD